MDVNVYWNKDHTEYAVLISPGYGAGWSTWNRKELAYDSRVVEYVMEHLEDPNWHSNISSGIYDHSTEKDDFRSFLAECGYNAPLIYLGGLRNIKIEWVPRGQFWRMEEYDGAENIEFLDMSDYINFM